MADQLPMLTEESVTPARDVSPAYSSPNASPNAFGYSLGSEMEQIGGDLGRIGYERRVERARRSAYSAEAAYGESLDSRIDQFKKEALGLKSTPDVDYPKMMDQLQEKYRTLIQQDQAKVQGALDDPLSVRMFETRMRLQTQAAHRHLTTVGEQQVASWDQASTDSRIQGYVRRAGNITGNAEQDAQNIGLQAGLAAKDLEDYHQRAGIPNEKSEVLKTKMEVDMVNEALKGYGSNFVAGMSLLKQEAGEDSNGKPITIGFDPSKPDQQSVLNGAETAKWVQHFTAHKTEKAGVDLGEILFQESRDTKHFNLENKLSELYKSGSYTPDMISKARQQYVSSVEHDHQLHEIGVANTFDAAYKTVAQNYNGDIELALKKDAGFRNMWVSLGPKQGELRRALSKEEADDPELYKPLGEVIDKSKVPGGLADAYPTTELFRAEYQGKLGPKLWPQALKMYESDVKRDTSQDVHYQVFKSDYEMRSRSKSVTGWTSGSGSGRGAWDEASIPQQKAHIWMVSQAEQAWADHVQSRKQTQGKLSDVAWQDETLSEISKKAGSLYKSGAFADGKPMPQMLGTPGSATSIKRKTPEGSTPEAAVEMTEDQYNKAAPGTWYRVPGSSTPMRKP